MSNPFGGDDGGEAVDALWVIISAFIIFTMQSGFGLLESGMVSRKSEANVMVKNMLDVALGGIAYWFVGFGFSFGPNDKDSNKMAGDGFFLFREGITTDSEAVEYTRYFFQLSFATTATTIVSGAVAERVKLSSYMVFALIMTGFIYVIPCHWVWGGGWLGDEGVHDFAGSSVVHMSGGAAAFSATLLLGPRRGRYSKGSAQTFYKLSGPTNIILGTFFLWWGWIGFNCGSTFAISGTSWRLASRIAVTTMNGAMAGGLSAVILSFALYCKRKYVLDIPQLASGILGGLVAITAPCAVVTTWEALIIGFIGGLIANSFIAFLDLIHIDDPVGCVGVHWAAGFWGMIATGLFANDSNLMHNGAFRGGGGKLLGYNILASLVITLWSGGMSFLVFIILKYTIGIRMSPEEEDLGSDEVEHNIKDDTTYLMEGNHSLGRKVQPPPVNGAFSSDLGSTNTAC